MCHITIYLDAKSQSMHNEILYNLRVIIFLFIVNEWINTCCRINHPQFLNKFICILYFNIYIYIYFFFNTYVNFDFINN